TPAPKPAPSPAPAPAPTPTPNPTNGYIKIDLDDHAARYPIPEQDVASRMLWYLVERELGVNVTDATNVVSLPPHTKDPNGKYVNLYEFADKWDIKDKKRAVGMMHYLIENIFKINVVDATETFQVPKFLDK